MVAQKVTLPHVLGVTPRFSETILIMEGGLKILPMTHSSKGAQKPDCWTLYSLRNSKSRLFCPIHSRSETPHQGLRMLCSRLACSRRPSSRRFVLKWMGLTIRLEGPSQSHQRKRNVPSSSNKPFSVWKPVPDGFPTCTRAFPSVGFMGWPRTGASD